MARGGGSKSGATPPRRPARGGGAAKGAKAGGAKGASKGAPRATRSRTPKGAAFEPAPAPRTFTLGAVPGATPGKWIATWRERLPDVPLELRSIPFSDQLDAVAAGDVDAAIVRLPVDDDALHAIPLYDEVTVAVVAAESHLTAADELELADLAGEVVIVPGDDVLDAVVPGAAAPAFAAPAETADAIATVAAGVGVVLVPLSIARLHARKDVETRPVRDAPISRVALAWRRDATTPDVESFVGIVRGRTANSSR